MTRTQPSHTHALVLIVAAALALLGCGQVTTTPGIDASDDPIDARPIADAAVASDAPPPDAPLPCDLGDINVIDPVTGGCYMLFTTNELWDTARVLCETRSAHLVTITDDTESAFVSNLVGTRDVWTGGNDLAVANTWEWITGEPFSFTNWANGEPNDATEHCIRADGDNGGRWHDTGCNTRLAYICERP